MAINLGRTSEEIAESINAAQEALQVLHTGFDYVFGEIIDAAREIYVREEMIEGLTAVATPGADYYNTWLNRQLVNEAAEEAAEFNVSVKPLNIDDGYCYAKGYDGDDYGDDYDDGYDDGYVDGHDAVTPVVDAGDSDVYIAGYAAGYDAATEDAEDDELN